MQKQKVITCAVIVLLAVGWLGAMRWWSQRLHRSVDPAAVAEVRVFGPSSSELKPVPADQAAQIVTWFNAGTDPRQSPENVGHVTTASGAFIILRSGEQIGLWPEGTDFIVSQAGNYYYLRHPELGAYLRQLQNR